MVPLRSNLYLQLELVDAILHDKDFLRLSVLKLRIDYNSEQRAKRRHGDTFGRRVKVYFYGESRRRLASCRQSFSIGPQRTSQAREKYPEFDLPEDTASSSFVERRNLPNM